MQNKITDRQLKKEKERLTNQKVQIEQIKEIRSYFAFNSLSYKIQEEIRKKWDNYYLKVKKSDGYKEYKQMLKVFKKGDLAEVRKLKQKARKRLEDGNFMPTPKETDPNEYGGGIYAGYRQICSRIKEITFKLTGKGDTAGIFS